jgi:hypothetical protein
MNLSHGSHSDGIYREDGSNIKDAPLAKCTGGTVTVKN